MQAKVEAKAAEVGRQQRELQTLTVSNWKKGVLVQAWTNGSFHIRRTEEGCR